MEPLLEYCPGCSSCGGSFWKLADGDRVGPDERGAALDKFIFAVSSEQVSREPMRALTRESHLETLLNPGGHGIILRHYWASQNFSPGYFSSLPAWILVMPETVVGKAGRKKE